MYLHDVECEIKKKKKKIVDACNVSLVKMFFFLDNILQCKSEYKLTTLLIES